MNYRTIDGKFAGNNLDKLINNDLMIIRKRCFVIENGYYRLLKIPDLEHLIPFIYGRYKISEFKFPLFLIENKLTRSIWFIKSQSLSDAISMFMLMNNK